MGFPCLWVRRWVVPPLLARGAGGGSGALVALVRRWWVVPLTSGRWVPLGGTRRPGNTTEYRVFTAVYDPNHYLRSMLIMLLCLPYMFVHVW